MSAAQTDQMHPIVELSHENGSAKIVLVCEHASSFIPSALDNLGLAPADRDSHAAWDPGALSVAELMAKNLGAVLVASGVSRLVFDCNRPLGAPDATPVQSERITVPGNVGLDATARAARAQTYYAPFRAALSQAISERETPAIVTIHSFTPIYHGERRQVDIGLLHDRDARLVDIMLEMAPTHTPLSVKRNAPYGPQDGVTHTLKEHALPAKLLNVMVEIRNDLIATPDSQEAMAQTLSCWITDALETAQRGQHA